MISQFIRGFVKQSSRYEGNVVAAKGDTSIPQVDKYTWLIYNFKEEEHTT